MNITTSKTASAKFIFCTMMIDMIGIGLLIPIMPDIIRRFSDDPVFISKYFGYFIAVYAFLQFIASPVLGALSDRFGRRSILLISLLGAGLDYIVMAFAPNLTVLFIGRIISGLTGASMTVASSYMADISDDKNRSANFGMLGAAFGLGFIVGPMLGGVLGSYGHKLPFLGAAVLNILNFLFGLFILPESLPPEKRRHIEIKKLNPLKSLIKILRPSPIVGLVWIYLLIYLAGQVHMSIWTLFTEYKFHWTSWQVGLSLSFVGFSFALSQAYLTRIIIPKIGEQKSLMLGIIVYILGFAAFGMVPQGWMIYPVIFVFAFSGVANPSIQSMISKHVPANEQGELQGSLISIGSLTTIVGPLFYTAVFAHFTNPTKFIFPGAPYAAASLICLGALILYRNQREKTQEII